MSCQYSTEVLQPGKEWFDFPQEFVPPQYTVIPRPGLSPNSTGLGDHLNLRFCEFLTRLIVLVAFVSYESLGKLLGKGFSKGIRNQGEFMQRSRLRFEGERKTRDVGHWRELRSLAALRVSRSEPTCLATTRVQPIRHLLKSSSPRCFRSVVSNSSTHLNVSSGSHCWYARWQVWYEGNPYSSCRGEYAEDQYARLL